MNTVDQRKKITWRKKKIDIWKVEKQSNKLVTFSKRRQGLFKKATELCILCDVNMAMIVSSPADKLFSFGRPDTGTVLNNYFSGTTEFEDEKSMESNYEYNREYEETLKMLELEKKKLLESEKLAKARGEWWNDSIDDMNCEELEQFMVSIYEFRNKLVEKEHEHLKMFSMK
ncbi:unnamed protein product [Lathyrus oleraceus]|uniref:agamous-like MADS-box protein AGL61 n=1 Tax=Pisum sativum TaxID=3888 RepID=UPI001FC5C82C|nr:agamous-like MADS-box protein AGL61 [Pisum sativum]